MQTLQKKGACKSICVNMNFSTQNHQHPPLQTAIWEKKKKNIEFKMSQCFSNLKVDVNHLVILVEDSGCVSEGGGHSALITSIQVMLMLLVQDHTWSYKDAGSFPFISTFSSHHSSEVRRAHNWKQVSTKARLQMCFKWIQSVEK